MTDLSVRFVTEPLTYTGAELRPHFLLSRFQLRGSALAAFIGPCRVDTAELVDWEDRLAEDRIEAASMLHFLGEFFGPTLRESVWMQRLLIAQLEAALRELLEKGGTSARSARIRRSGDDLFVALDGQDERKLSVSIVTASPVSQLLHLGINIDPAGAPVPAVGLRELGIEPEQLAALVLERFSAEWSEVSWACAKVRPVV